MSLPRRREIGILRLRLLPLLGLLWLPTNPHVIPTGNERFSLLCSIEAVWNAAPENPMLPETKRPSPSHTTYYVDARNGNDAHAGTSPGHAWQSLARVNASAFAPGDRLLFAGGQTFTGTLRLGKQHSGTKTLPLLVSSYGPGRATIEAGSGDGLLLTDCAYVNVRELCFVGCGRKNGSDGSGVHLLRTRNVELDGIEASGFRIAGVLTGGDVNTRLTHIYAHDNGSAGIMTHGGHGDVPRSRNLTISDCVAADNPGDPKNLTNHSGNGIVVGGVDGALIEYCEARNNGWDMPREGNGPVGIWGWNCDRLTIQHCISHDNKSPGADGGGFDFDGGVTNSVMQYNLSYDNMGCGYLLCQYPGAPPWKNNIVRYNISVNDGAKNFHSGIGLWLGGSGIGGARIYNNTILNPRHAVSTLGDLPRMVYRNNIFLAGEEILVGSFKQSRFESNLYGSSGKGALCRDGETLYTTLEEWAKATGQERIAGKLVGYGFAPALWMPKESPRSKLPTDPRQLAAMPCFRLCLPSPCLGAGLVIPDNGGRDFFGNRLSADRRPSLGAHEAGAF